jgi:hypothetical protein
MPVSLEEFGIVSGGFIRKLDSRNHWYPEMRDNDPRKRANLVSARIFNDPDNIRFFLDTPAVDGSRKRGLVFFPRHLWGERV